VPQISGQLSSCDRLGAWKARWGVGRMSYLLPPGLYAIGSPGPDDPVVVTANYKMSYDILRSTLHNRRVWLLVLETFGINVWCAAGKGTFGTEELVRRIAASSLAKVVSHRTLLLPILGAPGVAAHQVASRTGFRVRYAAIRASDLPEFLDNGMVTTQAMRELTFTWRERLVLIPVEVVHALKPTLILTILLVLIGWGVGDAGTGLSVAVAFLGAVAAGTVVAPLLLPCLPGSSFAIKGAVAGFVWGVIWYLLAGGGVEFPAVIGTILALSAVGSFYTLNFTGSTPFTSRSGVKKEMRIALPAMACTLFGAALLWAWAAFL
jgi:hypothetical protein